MIRHAHNGFLVTRDAKAVTGALIKLMHNKGLHARMSENARRTFLEKYEIGKVGEMYMRVYGVGDRVSEK